MLNVTQSVLDRLGITAETLANRDEFVKARLRGRWNRRFLSVEADAKTRKGGKLGVLTGILYLAPASVSGRNVCPWSTRECERGCLGWFAGRVAFTPSIRSARVRKTRMFFEDRVAFFCHLVASIQKLVRAADKRRMVPAVRLNGSSDIHTLRQFVDSFMPWLQSYDYTKDVEFAVAAAQRSGFTRMHVTYSHSGDVAKSLRVLANGGNVAVVFQGGILPDEWHGYPVVDGDETDVRFYDAPGAVVGLRPKGELKKQQDGNPFVVVQ